MIKKCQNLIVKEHMELLILLCNYESLFGGNLRNWDTELVESELKQVATSVCSLLYLVPKFHKEVTNKYI